jgi:hypothetical protein
MVSSLVNLQGYWTLTNFSQFELASRLVGVYKVNHMTKSVTIENRDYIEGR